MDAKVIILLVFLLFALVVGLLVSLGVLDISVMFMRIGKHEVMEHFDNTRVELIQPSAHSYWPIYYNGDYYWTWVVVKSNKELDSLDLITSFPLLEKPEVIQSGFDGEWYYYRIVLKTRKEPSIAEWVRLPAEYNPSGGSVVLYPQVEDVEGVGGVEIVAVIVKDMEVLPSLITFQMYKQLLNQYEKCILVIFQNTGDDFTYQGVIVTVNGQEVTPEKIIGEDGNEVQEGSIIKSGETFTAVVVGVEPKQVESVESTVQTSEGELTSGVEVLAGDRVTQGGKSANGGEVPVTFPSGLLINYDPDDPSTYKSDNVGVSSADSGDASVLPVYESNVISGNSGLDAGLYVISHDGSSAKAVFIGGNKDDKFNYVIRTSDGGYLAVGETWSYGFGYRDGLVVKFSKDLSVEWVRVIGWQYNDYFTTASEGSDGYVIGGYMDTYNADKLGHEAVLKLDKSGNLVWVVKLSYYAPVDKVYVTSDNNILVVGGGSDAFYVWKLDSSGNVLWERGISGWLTWNGYDIIEDSDGNYIVVGEGSRENTGYTGVAVVIKLDKDGNGIWARSVSSDGNHGFTEYFTKIIETRDGNYLMLGRWKDRAYNGKQLMIVEMDKNGNVINKKVVSSDGHPAPLTLIEAPNDYLIFFKEAVQTPSGEITKTGVFKWSDVLANNLPGTYSVSETIYVSNVDTRYIIKTESSLPLSVKEHGFSTTPYIAYWNPDYVVVPSIPIHFPTG